MFTASQRLQHLQGLALIERLKRLFSRDNDILHIRHEQALRALRTIAAAKRKTWEQRMATKCLREMGLK